MAKKQSTVSESLRQAILDSGMTIYALAAASGVSQGSIGRFVRRERDLQMANADLLCESLRLELRPTKKPKS